MPRRGGRARPPPFRNMSTLPASCQSRHTVWRAPLDQSGRFMRELGQDVYGFNAAIGLRVDPQDNVWTIDAAANQVVKFNVDGSIGLVLGRKPETIGVRPNVSAPGAPGAPGAPAAPGA